MADLIQESNDTNFEKDVLSADQLVIVDFWAEWCGPCRLLAPTLQKISENFAGKLKIVKINVDDNPSTASRYEVRGIPTLIFFKNGTILEQVVGNQSYDTLASRIENFLLK